MMSKLHQIRIAIATIHLFRKQLARLELMARMVYEGAQRGEGEGKAAGVKGGMVRTHAWCKYLQEFYFWHANGVEHDSPG
jgi:hypothetical protein